jgi:hypothetical protein
MTPLGKMLRSPPDPLVRPPQTTVPTVATVLRDGDGELQLTNEQRTATAAAIIKAAAKARGEGDDYESLPTDPVARAIVLSGCKRRGELVEEPRLQTEAERVAAMIIAAGRRRGEIS